MKNIKTISIHAKCSDMCNTKLINLNDQTVYEQSDHVPHGLGIGEGGDYINLQIDVETGKILNWDANKIKETIQEIIQ